ncbi:MAG: proline dehydrogenase family protein, partial [Acidobacteria bacterium]|nr:proline dehydrogenase family protein [Acidobacteriota bacterium]
HRRRRDVDAAFAVMVRRLMGSGAYPMIATHDERLIRFAQREAERAGRPRESLEFQMLYGVRRELQRRLLSGGWRLRVYVPFGSEWYPYLMRRIAERPSNLRFFLEALIRA